MNVSPRVIRRRCQHGIDLALRGDRQRHSAAMLLAPSTTSELRQRLRLPLLGVALAASVALLVWDRLDARLAAEAVHQAAAGHSRAVAALRADWAASVIPTALTADGVAGQDARRVALARIDLTIARTRRGETAPFEQLATATLDAIHDLERTATDAGAEWAEWLTSRLIEAARTLETERRIAFFAKADRTLARLAVRPRRRGVQVADVPVEPPKPAPTVEEPVEPVVVSLPPPPIQPEPPKRLVIATPPRRAAPREPAGWSPNWQADLPEPLAAAEEPTPAAEPAAEASEPTPRESDLRLLKELIELAERLPLETDEPSARGPRSRHRRQSVDPFEPVRERLLAVRKELSQRGYRSITRDQVEALLSDDSGVRRDLAERLLTDRSGDAARLLLLLAEDPAGGVREAAISALGSSSSRTLVEAAIKLATNDRDPRVGRLAKPLRERLR